MRIGVGKEIKIDERRVGMTPKGVKILLQKGHVVYVEKGAGIFAGYANTDYSEAGAKILEKDILYQESELIIKIKAPLEEEIPLLRDSQILFTYLHLDENAPPSYSESLMDMGIIGIAYEWVELNDGSHPLLTPMSEITGAIFAKRGIELLTEHKGILAGDFHRNLEPATATVIGAGTIGMHAIRVLLMNGLRVNVVDKTPETLLSRLKEYVPGNVLKNSENKINVILSDENDILGTQERISAILPDTDLLLSCAVRRASLPIERCKHLITREMIKLMEPDSVLIDATACDKDMVETCISSSKLYEVYKEENINHYCCDHIPSLTPVSSTKLLTEATLEYIVDISEKGVKRALLENEALFKGVMCINKKMVHKYTCEKKGLTYFDLYGIISSL